MGKGGQLKSNNTTVVYVGARKLKKVEIESILPTYQDIFQRLNSLRKGVDIEHWNAGNAQVNNTFAILWGRGTGKTSVMYSIREELQAATGVSKESSNDIILPILIPDNMKEESNIMGGICRARYNQCFVT